MSSIGATNEREMDSNRECHCINYYVQRVFENGLRKLGESIWDCPIGSILFAIFLTIIGAVGLFYFEIESKLTTNIHTTSHIINT